MSFETGPSAFVQRLLASAGFSVERHQGLWRAVRESDGRAVLLLAGAELPAGFSQIFPGQCRSRWVLFGSTPSAEERDRLHMDGVSFIEPDTLSERIGEVLLPSSGAEREEPVPRALPPARLPSIREHDGRERLMTDPGPFPEEPSSLPAELWPGERIVRPRLSEDDALRLAWSRLVPFRVTLVLIPYYLFEYTLRQEERRSNEAPRLLAVQGIDGTTESWAMGDRELVGMLPTPHRRREPVLSSDEARDFALRAALEANISHVDHTEQRGGALIIERRRVAPQEDDVRLGPAVMLHVPFWVVDGADGRLVFDAVTGAALAAGSVLEGGNGASRRP